jgi:hemerythrin
MLWNKSLETGIALIDAQHKELFRQIDDLMDAGKESRFGETLNFLEKYIVKHFSDEQKMHVTSNYPKAAKHREYHDNYVSTFTKLKAKYTKEGPTLENRLAINKTVIDWLKTHILVHDREFAEYYKSR